MKIERTFRNTDEPVIKAEFSAQEILRIFKKTNKNTNFICHALYSYIKAKITKKGNPLNREGTFMSIIPDEFAYPNLGNYELCVGADDEFTMSYQVMEWLQRQLGIGGDTIYEQLDTCDEIYERYMEYFNDNHRARIKILEDIAAKDNVPNLELVIFDI